MSKGAALAADCVDAVDAECVDNVPLMVTGKSLFDAVDATVDAPARVLVEDASATSAVLFMLHRMMSVVALYAVVVSSERQRDRG